MIGWRRKLTLIDSKLKRNQLCYFNLQMQIASHSKYLCNHSTWFWCHWVWGCCCKPVASSFSPTGCSAKSKLHAQLSDMSDTMPSLATMDHAVKLNGCPAGTEPLIDFTRSTYTQTCCPRGQGTVFMILSLEKRHAWILSCLFWLPGTYTDIIFFLWKTTYWLRSDLDAYLEVG